MNIINQDQKLVSSKKNSRLKQKPARSLPDYSADSAGPHPLNMFLAGLRKVRYSKRFYRVQRFVEDMIHPLCWWFGCKSHPQDPSPPEHLLCIRCKRTVPYGDMVGATRHRRFMDFCRWWFFRKWWPEKCSDCGRRFSCDNTIDHLPF